MDKEFLADRKAGLENAFFAQKDAILRWPLGEADESRMRREMLSAASASRTVLF